MSAQTKKHATQEAKSQHDCLHGYEQALLGSSAKNASRTGEQPVLGTCGRNPSVATRPSCSRQKDA
eukprot:2827310-Amphidinium_carterae.1